MINEHCKIQRLTRCGLRQGKCMACVKSLDTMTMYASDNVLEAESWIIPQIKSDPFCQHRNCSPLDCSRRRQMGSRTFILVVGVIPLVALDTNGGVWAFTQQGRKPHCSSQVHHSLTLSGASYLIALFIYFAMCIAYEIHRHHYGTSKLALICVS